MYSYGKLTETVYSTGKFPGLCQIASSCGFKAASCLLVSFQKTNFTSRMPYRVKKTDAATFI